MPNSGWTSHFLVRGGPLSGEMLMGWHITRDDGTTLGVCRDSDFCQFVTEAMELAHFINKYRLLSQLRERHDQGYMDHVKEKDWERIKQIMEATP